MMLLPLKIDSLNFGDAAEISGFGFILVLIVLAVLMLFVKLLSKIVGKGSKKKDEPISDTVAPAVNVAPITNQPVTEDVVTQTSPVTESALPYTPGYVTLDGVSEQDAAVIMAITSHESGIPLERLCFKHIKRLNQNPELINIEEQDAAVVMAIIAAKTGISLDNLIFTSINPVEE
jgi:Na+-transporting methylmalonyl-CoA/oxaloacetate decarboxylase gamma subunit